ncbi:MAG: hypothetical protein BWY63_02861 [Chloroflexi bacterium ADurb.Bin360]|nr:MAG: hypothetical protein BWY63_02861 [Chloroflexi bacterium ADurb.Bin360]
MREYVIKAYQKGFEQDQVRVGIAVARNWIWPYAYSLPDLLRIHAQSNFDPTTRHYCFLGAEMVGYMFSVIMPSEDGAVSTANLDFPRMMPGHEQAAELLIERAFETLKRRSVSRVVGRVTTMCPGDIRLAERVGFSISDWGYKAYYSYEMEWGRLNLPGGAAEEVDPQTDLDECAQIAARWYRRSPEWCRALLAEWHEAGLITHLGVREDGKLVAACMAAPNTVRPSTAAVYYIYTPDEHSLRPMLASVVNKCVDHGVHNVIADLVNEHRQYEPTYQELGFKKAAEWARCEKELA